MKKSISGIRGIFGDDLTLDDLVRFCDNFSNLIKSHQCVIGRDTRMSGKVISEAISKTIRQRGIDVLNLEIAPTPVIFREARNAGSGIIVTSSHNPLDWNGLKFIIDGRGINEIELHTVLESKSRKNQNTVGIEKKIRTNYVKEAAEIIGYIHSNPNVVLDIGGGAAIDVAPVLLETIGCRTKIINTNIESSRRGPDPTSDPLNDLVEYSKNNQIGFAFDLDGDRVVVVKDGKKQSPDVTLGLGVAKAMEIGYRKFVLSIDTSIAIEKFIKDNAGIVKRSKVGEANVMAEIENTESQAGGEGSSAGFILPEFNYCRDGILTSGLIASMLESKSFDEILKHMESFHQLREKMKIPANMHDKTIEALQKIMEKEFSEIITLDGIKGMIDESSWILVRKSNTEDLIRVSVEANDESRAKSVLAHGIRLVEQAYEKSKRE